MNKEPIALPDGGEVLWKTSEDNNILLETDGYGLKTSYDGTGYVIKIPYSTERRNYIQYINKLFTDSTFFDKNHLNVFIGTIAFYIPSHDWLISISLLIEFDSSGNIFPTNIDVLPLQLESSEEEGALKNFFVTSANVLRGACCFYTLCMIYLKLKYRTVLKHIAASVVRDIIQVFLSIIPLCMLWVLKGDITDELLSDENVDYHGIARRQILITYIDGLCIQFLSMKLVQSFRVFKYIDWMFYALGQSLRRIIIFFTAIMPFFFGMILTLHIQTGISVEETSTLTIATFSVYRFILGISKSQDFVV